jgi:hypothetical protein
MGLSSPRPRDSRSSPRPGSSLRQGSRARRTQFPQASAGDVVREERRVVNVRHPGEARHQHPKRRREAPEEHGGTLSPPYVRLCGLQMLVEVVADDREPPDRSVQQVGPPPASAGPVHLRLFAGLQSRDDGAPDGFRAVQLGASAGVAVGLPPHRASPTQWLSWPNGSSW